MDRPSSEDGDVDFDGVTHQDQDQISTSIYFFGGLTKPDRIQLIENHLPRLLSLFLWCEATHRLHLNAHSGLFCWRTQSFRNKLSPLLFLSSSGSSQNRISSGQNCSWKQTYSSKQIDSSKRIYFLKRIDSLSQMGSLKTIYSSK